MDEIERLLLIWINKKLDGDSISEGIICEKALRMYADLLKKTPSRITEGVTRPAYFGLKIPNRTYITKKRKIHACTQTHEG